MTKVTDACSAHPDRVVFICDFSPPRGGDPSLVEQAALLNVDFVCVAYNPGRSVRVNPVIVGATIKNHAHKEVIFALATRDMNKLALQSLLLGAQMLGLENVVVVKGDEFTERDRSMVKSVGDFTSTALIQSVRSMNEGVDFKGLKLRKATEFCVGAAVDLGRGVEHEARLAHQKVEAGAQFFITQPIFDAAAPRRFREAYQEVSGGDLASPVFYGVQILERDGVLFSSVPQAVRDDLDKGRPGTEMALELLDALVGAGVRTIYLVSPILKGGVRNYEAAQQVLEALKR